MNGISSISRPRSVPDCTWQKLDKGSLQASGILLNELDCKRCENLLHKSACPWIALVGSTYDEICRVCNREYEASSAGLLVLGGMHLKTHRYELLSCVFSEAKREHLSCPMRRILAIEESDGKFWVATTDVALARNIGDAVCQSYQGQLEYFYNPERNCLRVEWSH